MQARPEGPGDNSPGWRARKCRSPGWMANNVLRCWGVDVRGDKRLRWLGFRGQDQGMEECPAIEWSCAPTSRYARRDALGHW